MVKVYFACSIRGGRNDAELYEKLINHIKTSHIVLSEIFANNKLTSFGSAGKSSEIYKKDLDWIRSADSVVAEVSNPSLGVGYEIAKAEEWGIPTLALFHSDTTKRLSAMIDGSPKTKVVNYKDINQAYRAIDQFLEVISKNKAN